MPQVISFMNMKGGVGKTTLAVNVAYGLVKRKETTTDIIGESVAGSGGQHQRKQQEPSFQQAQAHKSEDIAAPFTVPIQFPTSAERGT
jgi:hypothetical protein